MRSQDFIYTVYVTDGYSDLESYYTTSFRTALDIKRRLKWKYTEYHMNSNCFQISKLYLNTTGEIETEY